MDIILIIYIAGAVLTFILGLFFSHEIQEIENIWDFIIYIVLWPLQLFKAFIKFWVNFVCSFFD